MVFQEFHKFLDNEIGLAELEKWLYENAKVENIIGEENYQSLLEYNYKRKSAEIDIQNFIFKNLIPEKEFSHWKMNKLLESIKIEIPDKNIYHYAKQNPHFLGGKELRFNNYWNKDEVEIFWTNKVSQFVRHTSERRKDNDKYLYLGTYEKSYIHLVANKEGEIWLAYDVVNKKDFWAKNLKEAIAKLIIRKY